MSTDTSVPVKYYTLGRVVVDNVPSGNTYVFVTKNNVCMSWVDPQDLDNLLARIKVCCGGHRRKPFSVATTQEATRWSK